ncbi:glucose-repressible alcohol dehydrogenase transcriptional effector [Rickenella mellea]|uniref:CCR4-Not complex 3'-5'-exoribonuclease subunit Ccr4 n=1 Tax=Rickenella mellea TaxID=50990 RepID=A0A4Y7QGX9_9AGAM|nr:glucose-repressible alcohol dehydrogenase transcriptional effector [Rickenella mellea]
MTHHWQQQLLKYDMVRASRSPHHRARQSALAARPAAKSAIPITNPNLIKPPDGDDTGSYDDLTHEDHPSSTAAPIGPSPRTTTTHSPENSWTSLDMGGINLKNIPRTSGLFGFAFLQNLYLNHNALSSIPPEISALRHLELLDLSGNALQSVPPELGMLTDLKELYLFDNHLVTLPPELGTLHQLQTLGIEGNPLDTSLKGIVQKDGTRALISYLRDSCPVPSPPPERMWKMLQTDAERKAQESDPSVETFSVLCYNILCERCATEQLYGYTPAWALGWEYRKELILTEVMNYDADILCLQEVDIAQYENYFLQHLAEQDYEGVYWPKSRANTMEDPQRRLVDGCATFFKASKYQLVEKQVVEFHRLAMQRPDFKKTDDMFNRVLRRDDIAVVTLLENKQTGTRIVVANLHMYWDPRYSDVKLVQIALLIDELEKITARFAKYPPKLPPTPTSPDGANKPSSTDNTNGIGSSSPPPPPPRPPPVYTDGTKIPLIVCGDFNSGPESGVYEFLAKGTVPSDHPDFMSHLYGDYTSEGLRHRLGLKSAYEGVDDLLLTNYVSSFHGMIDYIWYSVGNLGVTSVLGEVDRGYLSKVVGFPNAHFPSDHVCILSEFRVKPPKETPSHSHPPPVFKTNGSR